MKAERDYKLCHNRPPILELYEFEGHMPDPRKAIEWVIQSAIAGESEAMCSLAKLLLNSQHENFIG